MTARDLIGLSIETNTIAEANWDYDIAVALAHLSNGHDPISAVPI